MDDECREAVQHALTDIPYLLSRIKLGAGVSRGVFLGQCCASGEFVAVKRHHAVPSSRYYYDHESSSSSPRAMRGPTHNDNESTLDETAEQEGLVPLSRRPTKIFRADDESGDDNNEESAAVVMSRTATASQLYDHDEDETSILLRVPPHENIISCFAACRRRGVLVMPLMQSDLKLEMTRNNAALTQESVVRWVMYDLMSGLQHLHGTGVAHRDIKPGNILLSTDGTRFPLGVRVVIADFGSAHFTADRVHRSESVNQRGTLYYMSPETLLGRLHPAHGDRCDMWAAGCVLYELLTGTAAFCGSTQLEVFNLVCSKLGTSFAEFPLCTGSPRLFLELHDTGVMSAMAIDLLRRLLCVDPAQRLSASEALRHPFFADIGAHYAAYPNGRLPGGASLAQLNVSPLLSLCGSGVERSVAETADFKDIDAALSRGGVLAAAAAAGLAGDASCMRSFNSSDGSIHLSALRHQQRLSHTGAGVDMSSRRSGGEWGTRLFAAGNSSMTWSNQRTSAMFHQSSMSTSHLATVKAASDRRFEEDESSSGARHRHSAGTVGPLSSQASSSSSSLRYGGSDSDGTATVSGRDLVWKPSSWQHGHPSEQHGFVAQPCCSKSLAFDSPEK